jgi:DNA-binding SARP family transcriptional activator
MQLRILGPLEMRVEGQAVTLRGTKARSLLTVLALNANRVVSAERLIEELWGEDPPPTAASILQVRIAELRKVLRAAGRGDALITRAPGYQLALTPGELDAERFERLAAEGRASMTEGDPAGASRLLAEALSQWRGAACTEIADLRTARCEAVRLEQARLGVIEDRVDADLACGHHHTLVVELEALVEAHPLRERLWHQLMLALYRCGRQAEALRAYQKVRQILGEDLGIEPGPELRALERSILTQDQELDCPRPESSAEPASPSPGSMLPTGVVTFLLTDIERSSALWEADHEAMTESLARHDELIANAVAAGCGFLLKAKGEGDATLSVFQRATDAVSTALVLQRALGNESWPKGAQLRVRIAIHTGEALERAGDYYGPTVNRAARLRALAQGGQTLLSQVSAELVRDQLAPSATLIDLGQHALRDLARGERIFGLVPSLCADGSDGESSVSDAVREDKTHSHAIPLPPAVVPKGIFVGRRDELEYLSQAWKRTTAGERQAVLVGGESGIGKTTLAAELARLIHPEGATVLFGHCDEDLGVAYQPFVEALRHYVRSCPAEELHAHVASHGGDLARVVPELAQRVGIPPQVHSEPDAERLRMFESVAGLLTEAARRAPLLLVIDDLHWAAKPTLLLLKHLLTSSVSDALMVLGTYRDAELGRLHPLSGVLADLRRVEGVHRLALSGLDREGVAEFVDAVATAAGARVDPQGGVAFSRALYAETDGNPFFVAEVLRHFGESGMAYPYDGQWRTEHSVDEFQIPDGIREVIGRRVSRLSDSANRALTMASVIGRHFELGVLERMPELAADPDQLLDALDEAVRARIISEESGAPGRFSFCHSLVRQTLYAELTAARRSRLHQRVAEAIESAHSNDLMPHLPALAHHFAETTRGDQSAKAADYALRAADWATDQLAFEEASGYLERALGLVELDSPPDLGRRFELLLALGAARERLFDYPGATDATQRAAADARAIGSVERLARAACSGTPRRRFGSLSVDNEVVALCEEALAGLGEDDSALRAEVLAFLAAHRAFSGEGAASEPLAREALAMARRVGDGATLGRALMALSWSLWGSERAGEQLALAQELVDLGVASHNPLQELEGRLLRAPCRLALGDVGGFDADADDLARGARRLRWVYGAAHGALWKALRALMDGRFDEVDPLATAMLTHSGRDEDFLSAYGAQVIWAAFEQGRLEEVRSLVIETVEANLFVPVYRAFLAFLHAELGELTEARAIFEALEPAAFMALPRDLTWTAALALLSEVAVRLDCAGAAETLYDLLSPRAGQLLVVQGALCPGAADRYLGMLATTMGRTDYAEHHFAAGRALEERAGSAPLLARTDYWNAVMLFRRGAPGDTERASRLLDSARTTANRFGMTNLLCQAADLVHVRA